MNASASEEIEIDPPLANWRYLAEELGWTDAQIAYLADWERDWRYVISVFADKAELVSVRMCEPNPGQVVAHVTRWVHTRSDYDPVGSEDDGVHDTGPETCVATETPLIEAVFTFCECGPRHDEDCEFYEPPPRTWRERRDRFEAWLRQSIVRAAERAERDRQLAEIELSPAARENRARKAQTAKSKVARQERKDRLRDSQLRLVT